MPAIDVGDDGNEMGERRDLSDGSGNGRRTTAPMAGRA
ncbi:hypothetical protein EV292_11031 [Sphingomonas sp. BK235]|nr:hypothetical protein EV292_11031 [Sphingomonas sp. BK235]